MKHSISSMTSFEALYNQYFKSVYAYVLARTRAEAAAEDICASVWKKCYEKWVSYDESKGTFSQWLFTIARNETNMYRRLFWVRYFFPLAQTPEEILPGKDDTPLELLEQDALRHNLLNALETLSNPDRDLVSLKFFSGLNNRQIAAVTQLSETNVGTRLHRAIQKVRRQMEQL